MLASIFEALSGLDTSRAARRFRRAFIDFALSGAAFLVGVGFLVAAGFIFASNRYGPLYTSFGFGIGFIVLSALILVVHRAIASHRRRQREEEQKQAQFASMVGATALAVLPALIRARGGLGGMMLPAAALAAYVIFREQFGSTANVGDDSGDDDD